MFHFEKILNKKIDEIYVITTSIKNKQIKEAVLKLKRFRKESELFAGKKFYVIFTKNKNQEIEDVTNPIEIKIFVKTLYDKLKDLKRKNCKIDFLIAGGRKTMSIFSFIIATAIFDQYDKVWYLASSEEQLKNKDFLPVNNDSYNLIELPLIQPQDISPVIVANGYSFDRFIDEQKKRMMEKDIRQWKEFMTSLTKQEENIISLMMEGYSNKKIAEKMNISVRTVEHHVQNVYFKFKSAFLIKSKVSRAQFLTEILKRKKIE